MSTTTDFGNKWKHCIKHDLFYVELCTDCAIEASILKQEVPSGGMKHDSDKPDFTFISLELLTEVAKVRAFGAKKYSRDNWKKGFKVTRSLAAALRHIFTFLSGETVDSESGFSHLAHAVCCLEHAIYDMAHHPENDDRAAKGSE